MPTSPRSLDDTIAVLKREGAEIVKVELPDQRQLSAACQIVLATEAAAFHKRWLIERPQDYGPQVLMRLQNGLAIPGVLYLEAMRWRGPALAAHIAATSEVDAVLAPVAPVAAPTIAESDVGNSPDAEAVIQRLTRFTRPINYLGLPSLAIPSRLQRQGPSGRHAADRPLLRRSDLAHHRRGVPARDRFPREGAASRRDRLRNCCHGVTVGHQSCSGRCCRLRNGRHTCHYAARLVDARSVMRA